MAQSYRSQFLSVQKQNEAALKALFQQLARDIAAEVTKRADADGVVPRTATFDIQQAAGELVRRLFLGRNGRGELAPFDTVGNGAVIPLSPYMRQLWDAIKAAVRIPVEQNATILRNKLPADVQAIMQNATRNPFPVAKALVAEQIFRPNPLAVYDAPHEWVDPNGYRLSDRIWNVAALERRRLDLYLDTAIREGRGALQMSKELEQFLIPGRQLSTTNAPYGTTASYDAMRLARTEISQAHQRASVVSAAMNPFVSGLKWNLSASHPRIDICDDLARGGPGGDGVYSVGDYPGRPHPNCLCFATNVMIENPDAMIEQLRADVQAAKQEFVNLVGPLEVERFTQLLLGQGLSVERTGVASRVIVPPVVVTPPVVVPPPPPVDLAAEVRKQVIEIASEYEDRIAKLDAEMGRLEIELLRKPDDRALQRLYRTTVDDRRRLVEERDRRSREALYVDRPARVTMANLGLDRDLVDTWQRGMDEFNKLVSADVAPAQSVRFLDMPALTRSSYNPETKFVRMAVDAKERTVIHELGHWLEDHNPELHRKVVEFYERRTQGYPLEWMGPGYERHELTRKDKFIASYMGMEYVANGERRASEIVSMGLDHFFNQAALLAKGDPDMFDFIYRLVRGL